MTRLRTAPRAVDRVVLLGLASEGGRRCTYIATPGKLITAWSSPDEDGLHGV